MKIKLLLFVAVIACLSSCTNNDTSPINVSESDILGTWNVIDSEVEGTATITVGGITSSVSMVNTGRDYDFTFEFANNPNTVMALGTYTSVNTITVDGQTSVQEIPVSSIDGFDSGTWSVNGDQLTITANGRTSVATIAEFTGNLMVITTAVEETQNFQGVSVVLTGESSVTLQR
ncbi:MAG: lipocalin family protein [Flavobacteriaceae bacterium]